VNQHRHPISKNVLTVALDHVDTGEAVLGKLVGLGLHHLFELAELLLGGLFVVLLLNLVLDFVDDHPVDLEDGFEGDRRLEHLLVLRQAHSVHDVGSGVLLLLLNSHEGSASRILHRFTHSQDRSVELVSVRLLRVRVQPDDVFEYLLGPLLSIIREVAVDFGVATGVLGDGTRTLRRLLIHINNYN